MKRVNVILAMLVVVFGVTALSAQHGQRGHRSSHEKVFNQLDKNEDGKISKSEAEQAPRERLVNNFDRLDSNTNGYIEKSEFMEFNLRLNNRDGIIELADTDKDGKVSIEEALAFTQKREKEHLLRADKNNDGFLDQNELAEARPLRRGNDYRDRRPNPEKMLDLLDGNQDGKISKVEAEQAPRKYLSEHFCDFDQNEDEYIDLHELKNADHRCNNHLRHKDCYNRKNKCNHRRHHHGSHSRKNCNR